MMSPSRSTDGVLIVKVRTWFSGAASAGTGSTRVFIERYRGCRVIPIRSPRTGSWSHAHQRLLGLEELTVPGRRDRPRHGRAPVRRPEHRAVPAQLLPVCVVDVLGLNLARLRLGDKSEERR